MVEEYRMRGTMMYRKREKKRKGTFNIGERKMENQE
jgi:hypothetical protein